MLLVDDGELDDLKKIAEGCGAPTGRHDLLASERGWRQPQRLLVVSDRRPSGSGRPIAQGQNGFVTLAVLCDGSQAVRERVREMGLDLVAERPASHDALRGLVRDALYRGFAQGVAPRLLVGYPVVLHRGPAQA